MADEMECGDFGLTYSCKYVICVGEKNKYYRAAFLFNTGCFYSFFTLLFAFRTNEVREKIKVF